METIQAKKISKIKNNKNTASPSQYEQTPSEN